MSNPSYTPPFEHEMRTSGPSRYTSEIDADNTFGRADEDNDHHSAYAPESTPIREQLPPVGYFRAPGRNLSGEKLADDFRGPTEAEVAEAQSVALSRDSGLILSGEYEEDEFAVDVGPAPPFCDEILLSKGGLANVEMGEFSLQEAEGIQLKRPGFGEDSGLLDQPPNLEQQERIIRRPLADKTNKPLATMKAKSKAFARPILPPEKDLALILRQHDQDRIRRAQLRTAVNCAPVGGASTEQIEQGGTPHSFSALRTPRPKDRQPNSISSSDVPCGSDMIQRSHNLEALLSQQQNNHDLNVLPLVRPVFLHPLKRPTPGPVYSPYAGPAPSSGAPGTLGLMAAPSASQLIDKARPGFENLSYIYDALRTQGIILDESRSDPADPASDRTRPFHVLGGMCLAPKYVDARYLGEKPRGGEEGLGPYSVCHGRDAERKAFFVQEGRFQVPPKPKQVERQALLTARQPGRNRVAKTRGMPKKSIKPGYPSVGHR